MIRVVGVTRRYGSFLALDNVSFNAQRGQVLGFLGPNGAGKSTAMKIMTGFLAADSGEVHIGDLEVHSSPLESRKRIGWMPEAVPVYDEMEVAEYLHFCGQSRGVKGSTLKSAVDSAIERVELKVMRHRLIGNLSRGYRQRVGLAQAILHNPEVLILDEPTSGLDPTQIEGLHDLLRSLAHDEGKTIIFSTHILSEAEAIADALTVINRGKIVFDGTIPGLLEASAAPHLVIRSRTRFSSEVIERSKALDGASEVALEERSEEDRRLIVYLQEGVESDAFSLALASVLRDAGVETLEHTIKRPDLHDAFLELVAKHQPQEKESVA